MNKGKKRGKNERNSKRSKKIKIDQKRKNYKINHENVENFKKLRLKL